MTVKEFEHNIATAIRCRNLLQYSEAPVLVALSGGADSVALLAALTALGYKTEAAHCNFHLRGDESQRDMHHATAIANSLGVKLHIKDFDVPARMQATGESIEMAARALRYEWFDQLLQQVNAQAIAVGHHREDQAETLLLNALRGSGIAGLAAMAPRNGNIIRPMLDLTRNDIEQYLSDRNLRFVCDSSNADNTIKRNSLRNSVIPAMECQFANATDRLANTAQCVRDNLAFYNYAIQHIAQSFVDNTANAINIKALADAMPADAARVLLFEILRPYGFNMTHATNIMRGETGIFTAGNTIAELSRGTLTLRPNTRDNSVQDEVEVTLRQDISRPINIAVSELPIAEFAPRRNGKSGSTEIYLDATILADNQTFTLRHPRQGDRIRPFGMAGTRLVSDILKEARLSPQQKKQVWLLTIPSTDTILWIVGVRASAAYALSPATRHFLRLSLIP